MRGHVRKRGARWAYVVDVGVDAHGRRRQRWQGGFVTKREAEAALATVLARQRDGTYIEPNRLTLGEFLIERWLPAIEASVRPNTFASYRVHVRNHVAPNLGAVPLQRLTPDAINGLYAELLAGGPRRAAASPSTVRRVHATLHRALRDAVRWSLLSRNPAEHAALPKATRPQLRTWSAEELRTFLDRVEGNPLEALYRLMAMTGLRRGEALGLRWIDVDLRAGRIAVRQAVVPTRQGLTFGEPKTARGRRSVPLDEQTVELLAAHRKGQRREVRPRVSAGSTTISSSRARPASRSTPST